MIITALYKFHRFCIDAGFFLGATVGEGIAGGAKQVRLRV